MQSCRRIFDKVNLNDGANASLLMARCLKQIKGENDSADGAAQARNAIFEAMSAAARTTCPLYRLAFQRRSEAMNNLGAAAATFSTHGPLAIGLGNSSVLEVGLTLNPIYGTPMIPGSSLKGIVAHYCSTVLGPIDPNFQGAESGESTPPRRKAGQIYEVLFGRLPETLDGEVGSEAGYLRFYDAWMLPETVPSAFVPDVMTPHHMDYYGGKNEASPTDFDDPNPVAFMTVQGKFEVRIGVEEQNQAERERWLGLAMKLTEDALKTLGAGGKTRVGYGRMDRVFSAEEAENARKAQADNAHREAGFTHVLGETVTLTCTSAKPDKKKPEKINCDFAIDDKKNIVWACAKPQRRPDGSPMQKGDTIRGVIEKIDIDRTREKAYYVKLAE